MLPKTIRIFATIAAASVLLVCGNAAYSIYRDFTVTIAEHEVMASDLASVVADQAARTVRDTDLALVQVGEIVRAADGLPGLRSELARAQLLRIANRVPGGRGIRVFDASGRMVADSASHPARSAAAADRGQFDALAETDVLQVGSAINSGEGGGEFTFSLSRRIVDSHGRFVGVATASVATSHLTDFYNLFGFQKDPGVAVFRDNGDIIARRPDIKAYIGQNIGDRPLFRIRLTQAPQGVFHARSPMDGVERINAYRRVDAAGLVVLVGIPWAAATADWRERSARTVMIALFSCLAIVGAAIWGNASLRRLLAEQAARARMRTFLDMATHEFKTPLAVIDSSAQMLERLVDGEREGVGNRLAVIRGSVRRIVDLVDTCMAGARIDEGYHIQLAPFDPVALVHRVVERQRSHGANVDPDFAPDVAPAPPHPTVGDAALLGIALDALIDNARRYGPPGGRIEVAARGHDGSLVLEVRDRGPGITADEADRVFEKHYRGTNTRGVPGTGLGLSLVKTIAGLHGGTVALTAREGGGAIFTLTIPLPPTAGTKALDPIAITAVEATG